MTVEEALNRGNNLASTALLAIAGSAFLPEVIFESELPFKVDDSLLFIIGAVTVFWYRSGKNRLKRSVFPIWATVAALLTKVMAIILEIKDPEDVGDDFGALILFVAATILAIYLYTHRKKTTLTQAD